ncbi:S8 family serine peptidase, partial [Microcoleus sp. B4-C1]|uniref:S8 family serine peptidase n=1 Tax=Microcoleus sp. B4-C1 TaxID=2818660 RepID=UPI002FD6E756
LTPAERSAIEYARQNGVMLVVAAGNDGGVMSVLGQASQEFDNIFTVGAGDINGRSIYSSYGRGLDILADGGTTEHPGLSTVGNDLGTMAGTSVATAKVAGAASLVWAANPALNYRQVMEILKSTARDLGPSGWDDETGFGFLNTLAAVDLAKKTKPEVYQPIAFLKPTTWGGEGLVTPTERAVNIINENFTAWVVSSNGITLRNSPNTSDRSNYVVKTGDTLTFDGWTYGEQLSDLTTGEADALWYRFRYNGGTYWVPSAWTGGYPGSKPPLLPPTQQPPQQPPQQPTANTVYLSTSSGQILQVNTATGAQNPIYQGRAFTDLAVAPNGKLYGCTFYDGLYEINPSTGAERYVGPLAGGSLNSLTFSTDGRLYGADQGNGNLFQISPDNGQMNLIGNLGGPSSGDLVFNGANEILATVSSPNTSLNDRLVAVNLATGNSRYIGDLGLLEVYGLSWENGQLTAYTSDRRKLAIDPNTARVTVVGTVSSNGLIWGAATKPATTSSPTDDVRQKFLYAASLYPQVGAAITGMQDQGGGVFRQEFERAIMIWNGQQVTVYETKGRSVSPTSPSPNPQPVNKGNIGNNSGNGGGSGNSNPISGKGVTIRTGASGGSMGNSNSSGSSHASSSSSSSNSPSGNTSSDSSSSSANASSASNISESTGNNTGNNNWYNSFSDWGHGILDVGGFWPGLGAIPDAINTGWYSIEGLFGKKDAWKDAALSGMAIVPLIGDAAAGVGKGVKYIKPIRKLLTNDEAFALAKKLGFTERIPPQKTGGLSHNQPMFKNKKGETISQDIGSNNGTGSHNGGVWKKRDKNTKRLGTYNEDISVRIGD